MAEYGTEIISQILSGKTLINAESIGCIPKQFSYLTDYPKEWVSDTSIGIDETYAYQVVFYYPNHTTPTDTVTFKSEWMPIERMTEIPSKIYNLASGKSSVYSKGKKIKYFFLKFKNLDFTKFQRLKIFIENIVQGALKTFEYQDHRGDYYKVRYIEDSFKHYSLVWGKFEVELKLKVEED